MITNFTDRDVPDQAGKTVLVTGANTGIGYQTALVLARQGARVLLGCRNRDKCQAAIDSIRALHPDADLDPLALDLGDLSSVRQAAATLLDTEPHLDVLVNNAGVMVPPRTLTTDGFELQLGVNHLGPFALTGLLLPLLRQTTGARIVNTSSNGHRMGEPDFDDLTAEHSYRPLKRYGASKLANLLHTYELDRRFRAQDIPIVSAACHPGGTDTDLSRHVSPLLIAVIRPLAGWFLNQPPQGAWPTLAAATHPDVHGGQYFGPGWFELSGPATQVDSNARSKDPALARRLWDVSAELTGVDPGV